MIAVDTSALVAIVMREPMAEACKATLAAEDDLVVSAGTLAEVLIVSIGREIVAQMAEFLEQFEFNIVPAGCCMSATTSQKPISRAYFDHHE